MFRFASLLLATVAICATSFNTAARAQNPMFDAHGRVDVDKIRNQVLTRISMPNMTQSEVGALVDPLDATAESLMSWGLELMPVPKLLRPAHEALAQAGLLVTNVVPDSPAMHLGVQAGMVLLSVDAIPLTTLEDLPQLTPGMCLHVLTEDGIRSATVKEPKQEVASPATNAVSASSFSSSGDVISVSNVNGLVQIDATLKTQDGQKQIVLKGTRADIDRQIDQLPADLAKRLRQQVSY
jgi:hypothetical protein